jgi:predicted tellurium resistance membrane protein TerC
VEIFLEADAWLALLTLTALEIVLGVDNIVFISILSGKLPPEQRERARIVGLSLALFMRTALLFMLSIIIGLTAPLFVFLGQELSGRDLILIGGGLFLLGKATFEIHEMLEGEEETREARAAGSFASIIVQIVLLDAVFSLDSVITAVGMAEELLIMVAAVVIAIAVMLVLSGPIADFVHRHPTIKMLALSFLLLIGMALVADGWDLHVPKGYVYFAMGFSVFVELLNLRVRARRAAPVELRPTYVKEKAFESPPVERGEGRG